LFLVSSDRFLLYSIFSCAALAHEVATDTGLEIIPDPNIGFGSPAPSVSDLFPHNDYDRLNKEALGQPHLPRNTKQAVDLVLHDIKPSQRTH
jgi:hypothetical protein